jgi:hypothetical protein
MMVTVVDAYLSTWRSLWETDEQGIPLFHCYPYPCFSFFLSFDFFSFSGF